MTYLHIALTLLIGGGTTLAATPPPDPVRALEHDAHALRDLAPIGRMVGDATVVAVGEATHSSAEFITTKQRLFGHLAANKGFTTYAQEMSWSTGVLLNDYVLNGTGDPRTIMANELQAFHRWINVREFLDVVESIRRHNQRSATKLQIMGDDLAFPGAVLFDRVTAYVKENHPARSAELAALYAGQRPTTASLGEYMATYMAKPLAERQDMDKRAQQAVDLLERLSPGEGHDWAVQHARAIAQSAHEYGFDLADPVELLKAVAYREQVMADNVAWWNEKTGAKILLSVLNEHAAYVSPEPDLITKTQGAFLRDRLGARFLSVGFTFSRGSFYSGSAGATQKFTVGAAPKGNNEYTLDQVRYRDFSLDLRATTGNARAWLNVARPTRGIGQEYPAPDQLIALGKSYDVLIHLNRVTATHLLRR
ncbi:erythromycin esterase family protein [Nonomuraea sp. NPDC050556]|uniref:erythromycin esterase family protein n=1 Tax=Nonomuraea sp. NPDC050556 TaxID=3364369 RepID=UPI0037928DD5